MKSCHNILAEVILVMEEGNRVCTVWLVESQNCHLRTGSTGCGSISTQLPFSSRGLTALSRHILSDETEAEMDVNWRFTCCEIIYTPKITGSTVCNFSFKGNV